MEYANSEPNLHEAVVMLLGGEKYVELAAGGCMEGALWHSEGS